MVCVNIDRANLCVSLLKRLCVRVCVCGCVWAEREAGAGKFAFSFSLKESKFRIEIFLGPFRSCPFSVSFWPASELFSFSRTQTLEVDEETPFFMTLICLLV